MRVDQELTKRYYTIGEVAAMFAVSNSLVRYWETEFALLKPHKTRKGDRRYTVKDIRLLERIYTLVKERGFTLDGARKELKRKVPTTAGHAELTSKLAALQTKLKAIRANLDKL